MKTEELLRYRDMYREMRARLGARYIVYGFRPAESPAPDQARAGDEDETGRGRVENEPN